MKASELRIGNLVGITYASGCNHLEAEFEIEEIREESVHFKGFAFGEFYKDLKPIPLTEEWLLRFGFKRYLNSATGSWVYMFNGRKFFYQSVSTGEIFSYDNDRIRYVHQVQNLVFALMGEDI